MKNITLSIDENTLREVRKIAAERDTSVNALVREFLEALAAREQRQAEMRQRIGEFAKRSRAVVGPVTWTREDSHDR